MDTQSFNLNSSSSSNEGSSWLKWIFTKILLPVTLPIMLIRVFLSSYSTRWLKGKVVLITGASSGLGEALAHKFYSHGCKVILVSRRREELERVKSDLLEQHSTSPTYPPVVFPMDISELNSIPAKVSEILKIHQGVDILVNNAGVSYRGSVEETSLEVHVKVMVTNYFGQVALIKAVLPHMIGQRQGHILVISSIQGLVALPHRSAYTASKHAMQGFCDSLRSEVAPYAIKVTVASPGYIHTNLSINALTSTGGCHGVMDKSTHEGMSPHECATKILSAMVKQDQEVMIAPVIPRLLVYLRFLCPQLYFWLMEKRAIQNNKVQ